MCFPVWRELKHVSEKILKRFVLKRCLNVLSRLKGIETKIKNQFANNQREMFKCAFPFEGNWNRLESTGGLTLIEQFKCAFPFEGNWNTSSALAKPVMTGLNVLSRLKGIETRLRVIFIDSLFCSLNVLSRLKGIETHPQPEPLHRQRPRV